MNTHDLIYSYMFMIVLSPKNAAGNLQINIDVQWTFLAGKTNKIILLE